jgi:hypothetical protein
LAQVGGNAMTLSVPSALAAAIRAFIPPPACADVAVTHFLSPPEDDPPDDDEQPAAASASTTAPAAPTLYAVFVLFAT